MLSDFTAPPTVTCFLCKAWISVKKGDKTRFFNHISNDHEVHFDMELLYAISYMTDKEKETVIGLMNQRVINPDTSADQTSSEPGTETEVMEEGDEVTLDEDEELEKVSQMIKKKPRPADNKPAPLISRPASSEDKETVAPAGDFTKSSMLDVKINENGEMRCTKCPVAVSRKTLRKHMQNQHRMKLCRFCEKYMGIGNFARHLRTIHKKNTLDHEKLSKVKTAVKVETSVQPTPGQQQPAEVSESKSEGMRDKSKFKRCKLCFKITSVQNFERHLREKHTGVRHSCSLCYMTFSRLYIVKDHITAHHSGDKHLLREDQSPTFTSSDCQVDCASCDLKFITEDAMLVHASKNHGNGTRLCDRCQKRFMGSLSLKKHLETCTGSD